MCEPNSLQIPANKSKAYALGWLACEINDRVCPFNRANQLQEWLDWYDGQHDRADIGFAVNHLLRKASGAFA